MLFNQRTDSPWLGAKDVMVLADTLITPTDQHGRLDGPHLGLVA